jgi:hypothetical protein
MGVTLGSLTLREEHRLRVFENRVLRRIFEPKGDEVTGDWGKLHNEELHNLYSSPNIIRQIKSMKLAKKLCKICFGLRVVKRVSGLESVRILYYAYFQSLSSYGLIFWGNSANAKLIFRLQKRAIGAMMQIQKTASCKQYCHILGFPW